MCSFFLNVYLIFFLFQCLLIIFSYFYYCLTGSFAGVDGGFENNEPEYEETQHIVILPDYVTLPFPSVELPEKVLFGHTFCVLFYFLAHFFLLILVLEESDDLDKGICSQFCLLFSFELVGKVGS